MKTLMKSAVKQKQAQSGFKVLRLPFSGQPIHDPSRQEHVLSAFFAA